MSDYQARAIANDKSDPANWRDDNCVRRCRECEDDIKIDVYKDAKLAEVEEFDYCYQHLTDVEGLREEAHNKAADAYYWKKRAKAHEELYNVTEKDNATLREKLTELESRVRYKEDLLLEARIGLVTLCENISKES